MDELSSRFRVVLPDLPLHGDSEDRPRHPYTADWLAEVIAGFCREVAGPRPLIAGHDIGAELALREPSRPAGCSRRGWRCCPTGSTGATNSPASARRGASFAGPPRFRGSTARSRAARRSCSGPRSASACPRSAIPPRATWFATPSPTSPGNGNRARSWAKFARRWPADAQRELLDAYPRIDIPVLLLWADADPAHPLIGAYQALDLLPNCQLRTLPGTGFLMAYDDPVGVARELISFFG